MVWVPWGREGVRQLFELAVLLQHSTSPPSSLQHICPLVPVRAVVIERVVPAGALLRTNRSVSPACGPSWQVNRFPQATFSRSTATPGAPALAEPSLTCTQLCAST